MRILIHVHIYYRNLLPEIARCVCNIRTANGPGVVVFATCPMECELDFEREIGEFLAPDRLLKVPNRGYDIGPFFEVLSQENLGRYDLVIKLHTKRDAPPLWVNFRKLVGSEWREELLSPFNSIDVARRTIESFGKYGALGMVAGRRIIDVNGFAVHTDQHKIEESLNMLGLRHKHPLRVWGSMFAIRASVLGKMKMLRIGDFRMVEACSAHHDYGLATFYEELIPVIVQAAGYEISSCTIPLWLEQIKFSALRPVYGGVRLLANMYRTVKLRHST